jgi:cytoskeletal protein CcmA (bactofilin family)
MWKKDEVSNDRPAPRPDVARGPGPGGPRPPGERATIGRSITIRGEVTGDEDLLIQGRVEGSVDLKQHAVTVGPDGKVKASITARVVTVEGTVQGDLTADEQLILRSSARVEGDMTAARVVLEDGARFRGGVDMGEVSDRSPRTDPAPSAQPKPATEVDRTPAPSGADGSNKGKATSDAAAGSRK